MTFDLDERALTAPEPTPTDDRFLEGIRELLPESTGVSLARIEDGHPYTALSIDEQVAALGRRAVRRRRSVRGRSGVRDPGPVEGRTVGTLNLYVTADGELDDGDAALEVGPDGISGPRAIREASFTGRLGAALRPERLRDRNEVDWAVGLLSGLLGIDPADASDRRCTGMPG
jgi:hypothetical protein